MENSEEKDNDSGYEDPCFIANEYREERIFEDKFYDPMLEELFSAAKEDQAYQKVLAEVKKGLTKDALKLLPPDHPAWAMAQQWGEIGLMRRHQDGLLVYPGVKEEDKGVLTSSPPRPAPYLSSRCTTLLVARRVSRGDIQADGGVPDMHNILSIQTAGGGG